MTNDITSSQTWGPVAVRDLGELDLGFQYPAIDYVINGVTVNNATLNIDPGTVIAYVGCGPIYPDSAAYDWGIRLNPGGRLNVNGYPTNRVTFARLEVDGCLFQGGTLFFEDGGPEGRSVAVRNTVFERADFELRYTGDYEGFYGLPSFSTQVTVSNALYYGGYVGLMPRDPSGAQWTFVDNIFDRVTWAQSCPEPWNCLDLNGPVGWCNAAEMGTMPTDLVKKALIVEFDLAKGEIKAIRIEDPDLLQFLTGRRLEPR